MISKNKRILWLLNHRTLMPYEAPLIRRLGFEIFTPKVIPKANFRSAAADFSHDESLTIPPSNDRGDQRIVTASEDKPHGCGTPKAASSWPLFKAIRLG